MKIYNSPLLEARYGDEIRHQQMKMGIGSEIKLLVLQVLSDANSALTHTEIAEKVKLLLPENVAKMLNIEPYYLSVYDIVDGALTGLYRDGGKVRKKEVYYLPQKHDA